MKLVYTIVPLGMVFTIQSHITSCIEQDLTIYMYINTPHKQTTKESISVYNNIISYAFTSTVAEWLNMSNTGMSAICLLYTDINEIEVKRSLYIHYWNSLSTVQMHRASINCTCIKQQGNYMHSLAISICIIVILLQLPSLYVLGLGNISIFIATFSIADILHNQ